MYGYMYKGQRDVLSKWFLTEVHKKTKKTQAHKQELLRLLWRPSREIFKVGL